MTHNDKGNGSRNACGVPGVAATVGSGLYLFVYFKSQVFRQSQPPNRWPLILGTTARLTQGVGLSKSVNTRATRHLLEILTRTAEFHEPEFSKEAFRQQSKLKNSGIHMRVDFSKTYFRFYIYERYIGLTVNNYAAVIDRVLRALTTVAPGKRKGGRIRGKRP